MMAATNGIAAYELIQKLQVPLSQRTAGGELES